MNTYDHELILVKQEFKIIPPGESEVTETSTSVLCNVRSAGQKEFYKGRQSGLKPEYEFTIHVFEYDGQQEVEFNRKRYSVIRTHSVDFEEIQLICGLKA